MKLKAILAASAFAVSLVFLPDGAQARVSQHRGGQETVQDNDVSGQGDYGQGQRRRGGEGRQRSHNPQQGYQPPQGGYQPPPPPPQAAAQQNHPYAGQRHPRGGHRPPPPPVADPRYADGHYGHRAHDRDRKRRRERFRDGAAVVLGLGVLGALASQPHYDDRYDDYPQQPYQPEYEPEYQPGYDPNHAYGQGHPGQGYGYDDQYGGGVFRCSSNDYRTTFCQIPRGARANIRRRLSKASCNYGRDWGIAPNAVWVANGCRAEFHLY